MAYSEISYTGDGVTNDYAVPFNYLSTDHVFVAVDYVLTTAIGSDYAFEWIDPATIRVRTVVGLDPVPSGVDIRVYRRTPIATPAVVFGGGASLSSVNLNKNSDYLTYALQEATDSNDAFVTKYLGAFAEAPTVDNSGNALIDGALYFNTTSDTLFAWNGTAWVTTRGLTGIQGDIGPQGIQGEIGIGIQGEKGDKGDTGDTGGAGSDGTNGTNGTNGAGVPTGGTTGQLLSKINGTDFNTQWIAAPSTGLLVNLGTFNFSGDSVADYLTFDDSIYAAYEFEFTDVIPSSDGALLRLRFYNGGALLTSNYQYAHSSMDASAGVDVLSSTTSSSLMQLTGTVGSAGGEQGISGRITVRAPQTAGKTKLLFNLAYDDTAGNLAWSDGAGQHDSITAVSGIRFFYSAGTFESGRLIVYGIKK